MTASEWYFAGHFPTLPVMPGVLQVEALAQTMAIYVAREEGFGDRIGLFGGIDDCRFKRVVQPGDRLTLEVTMEKLGRRFGRGRAVGLGRRRGRLRGDDLLHHPAGRDAPLMGQTLALLSDVHGNVAALDAALADIKASKADRIVILGDLALNGPRPAETVARVMELDAAGAIVIAGNTDIAVADGDYAAAFPWLDEVPSAHQAAAEWARDQLADEQLDYLRRLPAERRLWSGDDLVLACHASPGSQTSGLAGRPRRVADRPAGHPHRRPRHRVRPHPCRGLARAGSQAHRQPGLLRLCLRWLAGCVLGAPRAAGRRRPPTCELHRPTYDAQAASIEVSARGLPGDVYRAATIRTGRFVR